MAYRIPSVLSIAGSDSSGGAGIQADIKTVEALGLFAQTAVTSITAQNTLGVTAVADVDPGIVSAQIKAVFDDIRPQAVKIGMVSSAAIVEAVADALSSCGAEHIVVDPVMVATSGARLISDDAREALVERLFPMADVVTPNVPEAESLTGRNISSADDMRAAAADIALLCGGAVLVKGGHATGGADDVLLCGGMYRVFRSERVDTRNTHGTGCTLSSAIACGLARGLSIPDACREAKEYVFGALRAGLAMGKGSGPLDHQWPFRRADGTLAELRG